MNTVGNCKKLIADLSSIRKIVETKIPIIKKTVTESEASIENLAVQVRALEENAELKQRIDFLEDENNHLLMRLEDVLGRII